MSGRGGSLVREDEWAVQVAFASLSSQFVPDASLKLEDRRCRCAEWAEPRARPYLALAGLSFFWGRCTRAFWQVCPNSLVSRPSLVVSCAWFVFTCHHFHMLAGSGGDLNLDFLVVPPEKISVGQKCRLAGKASHSTRTMVQWLWRSKHVPVS